MPNWRTRCTSFTSARAAPLQHANDAPTATTSDDGRPSRIKLRRNGTDGKVAQNLAASAKNPLVSDDELTLNLLVKDAMKDSDVAYIIITDEKGQIRAHSDISQIGEEVQRPAPLAPASDQITVTSYRLRQGPALAGPCFRVFIGSMIGQRIRS